MSDGILKEKREKHRITPFFPVTSEIMLIFILLIIVGGLAMHFALREELLRYEAGMYRLSVEQLLEAEAEHFLAFDQKSGTDPVDMKELEEVRNGTYASEDISFTGTLAFGFTEWERTRRRNSIHLTYVFSDGTGSLTELSVHSGTSSAVDPDSERGQALMKVIHDRKIEEVVLGTGETKRRTRMLPIKIFSPVKYGDTLLSQGGRRSSAVICASYYEMQELKNSRRRGMMISLIPLSGLILFAVLVSAIIYYSLRVFKPIQACMEAIRRGEAEKAEEEGRKIRELMSTPEIRELQDNVQLMFLSIREYSANVSSIIKEYEPLLPGALLKWFGKDDIREICPGDEAVMNGISVYVGLEDEPGQRDVPFRDRNKLISGAVDAASLLGGTVVAIGYRHIRAFFTEEAKAKLPDYIREVRDLELQGTGVRRIRISCSEGNSTFSVIGVRERMALRQDQKTVDLLSEMDRLQQTYRLEPLFAGEGADAVPESRELWKLSGGEAFYELLNGKEESAARKRGTKSRWEKALELLRLEKYKEALEGFSAVLRADKSDGAAGYLLEHCEKKKEQQGQK